MSGAAAIKAEIESYLVVVMSCGGGGGGSISCGSPVGLSGQTYLSSCLPILIRSFGFGLQPFDSCVFCDSCRVGYGLRHFPLS